jgi:hypothetical protein
LLIVLGFIFATITFCEEDGKLDKIKALARNDDSSAQLDKIKVLARNGDLYAQYKLGFKYYYGIDIAEDKTTAFMWYYKSAEQGYPEAQWQLGDCYYNGQVVAQDYSAAVKWYRAAADQGFSEGQFGLGLCYLKGNGVAQNEVEAFKWFRKAAYQGHSEANFYLGFCYCKGTGVVKDDIEAYAHLSIASSIVLPARSALELLEATMPPEARLKGEQHTHELGKEIRARIAAKKAVQQDLALGNCYFEGRMGVRQDVIVAVGWFRKAAVQGSAEAQFNLGYCYANGRGVVKDEVEAYAYFNLAGLTLERARQARASLEVTMSPEDRLKGQQRAAEMQKEIEKNERGG